MLGPVLGSVPDHRAREGVLPQELEFYQPHDWCLTPYLTVSEAIIHLAEEVDKLSITNCQTRSGKLQRL